jgi:3-phenylpropionate/trans-cinnamate dioxygenase ferredoxin component
LPGTPGDTLATAGEFFTTPEVDMHAAYVPVARTEDIPPGTLKRVLHAGHAYLLANVDGRFFAVDDTCSHEDFSLSYGCLEGERVKCSLHGSRFCLHTGRPLEEPAEEPINTYRLAIDAGQLWLDPVPSNGL